MSTALRDDLKVGGNYAAVANGDGTFNIKDICIFAEIPAGAKKNREPIGREWQEAALLQSKSRAMDGHLPPVHIYHSDEVSVKPIYAGKFKLTTVRQIVYEGKRLWATFADILGMPGEVFEKVRKGFLPYRSVEIHNWAKPEIDSLALMDTDVPFFRMPMLTVGSVMQREDNEIFMDKSRPSQACRMGKKQGAMVLFRFAERGDMPGKEEDEDKDKSPDVQKPGLNAPPKAEQGEPDHTEPESPKPNAQEGPGGAEMEGEPGDHAEPDGDEASPAADPPEKAENSQVLSMLQKLGTMLTKLNERLGPQPEPQEKHEAVGGMNLGLEAQNQDFRNTDNTKENGMAENKPAGGAAPEKFSMTKDEIAELVAKTAEQAVLKATAPLQAELATFKVASEKAAQAASAKTMVSDAVKKLREAGRFVDEKIEGLLAKAATHGADFFKEQVEVFETSLPEEPPADGANFEDRLVSKATNAVNEDEINAFCAEHGPQHAGWAKKQMAQFRAWQASGGDGTADEWLSVNFRSATMAERNRV